MAKANGNLESQQGAIKKIKSDISDAKKIYSQALYSLEVISEEIHCRRIGKNQAKTTGENNQLNE